MSKEDKRSNNVDPLAEALLRRLENALLLGDNLDTDERERIVEERGIRDFDTWALSSDYGKPFRTIEGEFTVLEPETPAPQPIKPLEPQPPDQT